MESTKKFIKEVSAFANTFGGYIFLGIEDDKTISGCKKWTEQRIHTAIHDSLTPVPTFDVRRFTIDGNIVLVVRIEEGNMPPYITNDGLIYERVSSGSYPIKDSHRLTQFYNKGQQQLQRIANKIEIEPIRLDYGCPDNLCAYIDIGFSLTCSHPTKFEEHFFEFDYSNIAAYLKNKVQDFSISLTGQSIAIAIVPVTARNSRGEEMSLNSGIQNYIEIMRDGSAKCRLLLSLEKDSNSNSASITVIDYGLSVFVSAYRAIMEDSLFKSFICAHKYERLTVIKQFVPYYYLNNSNPPEDIESYAKYLAKHQEKYGNN